MLRFEWWVQEVNTPVHSYNVTQRIGQRDGNLRREGAENTGDLEAGRLMGGGWAGPG